MSLPPATVPLAAQKKPIAYDAYDGWRSIEGTRLSHDGAWVVYALVPQEGDGELVARNLKTGAEYRYQRGKPPLEITPDGAFVVFTIAPRQADVDKAKKEKKKPEDQPKNGLGIMALAGGGVVTVDRARSFKVPEESSRWVAYLMEPVKEKKDAEEKKPEEQPRKKEKKKDPGTDLVVRDLTNGQSTTIGEVTEYAWTRDGNWLAYAVSSKTPEADRAALLRPAEGTTYELLKGQGHYKSLAFDHAGAQLAFVSDRDEYKNDPAAYKLYYVPGLKGGPSSAAKPGSAAVVAKFGSASAVKAPSPVELVSGSTPGMPPTFAVSEHGKVLFSKDGSKLFLGTATLPPPDPEDAPEPVKVDIWTWKDALLQPMQKVRAEEEKKRNYQAVVHLKDRTFVQLGSPDMPDVNFTEGTASALGESDVPYRQLMSWDGSYQDIFVVDVTTGARRKVLEKSHFGARLSAGGGYLLWYDDASHAWFSQKTTAGARPVNLTGALKVSFEDETWDSPGQPMPYGTAGWTDNDKSVLIYDRYDIWEVKPDGSGARALTQGIGRQTRVVFRYQRLDLEERTIPATQPLLLSATDERTKASGFYRISFSGSSGPEKILMADRLFGGLVKAKNAERFVLTAQRFEEFPDLWTTDGSFADLKKISEANPQQAGYLWGTAELIDYTNADGRPLRAALFKPENFDPAKKYPLIVYIYEELTSGLHRYVPPGPSRSSINVTRYVSNGYVVLEPDIAYETGYPGESAQKCVIPAVQKVVAMGFIDPARIGIQGHSWGGYQISYLITRTNMFRAVEAGASVVDMISAYGGIRWGTGMSRAFQYEKTQSRIGAPPWEAPLQFIENSPIFWVEKVRTPYLTMHNDDDDAVPWYQGIEFFTALRRLGKEAYMFVYNGEKHGLRERENQKHWAVHMDEYFDHFLLGARRPDWMDTGVPYLEKGKRDITPLFGAKKIPSDRPRP
jgi:dipeptidyl aminopeptidase/acylaminoacyl peptidase